MQGNPVMQVPFLHGYGDQKTTQEKIDKMVAIGTRDLTGTQYTQLR
jgi:hypothetical protein